MDSYRVLTICMGRVDTKMPHLGPTVTESLATPLIAIGGSRLSITFPKWRVARDTNLKWLRCDILVCKVYVGIMSLLT